MWKVYPAQSLTQNDSYVVGQDTTQAIMSDLFVWTIPRNTAILINPTDVISAALVKVGSGAVADTDQWELAIRNANSGEQVSKISSGIYVMITEFTDQTKVKRIGGKYLLEADFVLSFRVNCLAAAVDWDAAGTYINIGCTKYVKVSPTL